MRNDRIVLRVVAWITLLSAAGRVWAQPTTAAEADRLFEQGRELAKAGKYAEACDRFTQSFMFDHATGTELNLGDCNEQQGHLREALRFYTAAETEYEHAGNPARAKFAHDRVKAVTAKLVTITVNIAEPQASGLTVTIGGKPVPPAAEIHEVADPGVVEITATVPGHPRFTTSAQGVAGATLVFAIPAFSAPAPTTSTIPAPPGERSPQRVHIAYALAGVGGASAIAAVVLALKGRSDYNDAANSPDCMRDDSGVVCNSTGSSKIASAQHLADLGTGFAIGGAALIAAGAIVYFTAPRDGTTVTPTATAQSVGLAISTRF